MLCLSHSQQRQITDGITGQDYWEQLQFTAEQDILPLVLRRCWLRHKKRWYVNWYVLYLILTLELFNPSAGVFMELTGTPVWAEFQQKLWSILTHLLMGGNWSDCFKPAALHSTRITVSQQWRQPYLLYNCSVCSETILSVRKIAIFNDFHILWTICSLSIFRTLISATIQ